MDYLKIRQKMIFILQIAAVGLIAAIIILVCLPATFYRTKESKVVAETQTSPVAAPEVTKVPKPEEVEKYVALTFDDGPTPTVTNRILDTLERHGARATFFVVGRQVKHDKDLIKRAANLGCEIGNHTWEHRQMTKFTKKV